MTGFYDRVIHDGQQLISQATDIYFIGYRANDNIIQTFIEAVQPETKLHVVSRENKEKKTNAETLMKDILRWASPLTKGNLIEGKAYNGGFKDFVVEYASERIES